MNWKRLRTNPPAASCVIVCLCDYTTYRAIFTARYDNIDSSIRETDRYGREIGIKQNTDTLSDNFYYINLNDIKP